MRTVYGVGTNDADYAVAPRVSGKQVRCPYYRVWHSMLSRCYQKKLHARRPTYIGCVVCPEWLYFMTFRAWMETQDWEGKQLDKDILGGGKVYSPATCCFVPRWLNLLLNDSRAIRGKYPIGVCKQGNRFQASLLVRGKITYLGLFGSPPEAHKAYKREKQSYVNELMVDYPDSHIRREIMRRYA